MYICNMTIISNIGVYQIRNIITNDIYIGSASRIGKCKSESGFHKRFEKHRNSLKLNIHHSIILQRAYNKYGVSNFKYEILANCPPEYCIKLEQWFLNILKPKYNIRKIADSNLGSIFSDKTKLKMSNSQKGKINTEESKERMKIAARIRLNDASKMGNNKRIKLNWDKVKNIRESKFKAKELSKKYNVSLATIYHIKRNQIWVV